MKAKHITDYLTGLLAQLHAIQSQTLPDYTYKIVGKEKCKKTGEERLVIQMTGKNVICKYSPQKLLAEESLLQGFSPLDVRTITYLACKADKPQEKKLFRIIAQFFSRNRKEEMLVIQAAGEKTQITKSVQEISNNPEMITNFNSQDAHRIGYVAGIEQGTAEAEFLSQEKLT